jgi:stearoyl-CoA desaturase (delta-9 desaturase)
MSTHAAASSPAARSQPTPSQPLATQRGGEGQELINSRGTSAGPRPMLHGRRPGSEQLLVTLFIVLPTLALIAAVPFAWGWGLTWTDIGLAVFFYLLCGLGVTAGFHRYFTHRAFKANRALRIALAVAGSMAFQGSIITWVADHRRHHIFTDKEGDPHSPWLFGTSAAAVAKGFWHAHLGWLFQKDMTNTYRFAPDLLSDPDIRRVNQQNVGWSTLSLTMPVLLGGLISWSWWGGLTAFFWAGLVRIAALHHITWSTNSICHMIGNRPFTQRDRSTNFWPLAILSMGESWHNLHHADPTCARHGVRRGQVDMTARLIWIFEKFGWAHDVRWPSTRRLARVSPAQ